MKTAFLFPGQGAQAVGMGKDLAEACPVAADIFSKANDIVGYDLRRLCFEGPEEKLNSTTISQPAIFATSVALLESLRAKTELASITPDVTAGLSLGEYTALYAAGVMSFEEGLKLVQKRGNAMQAAADASEGSMVSVLGLDAEKVEELCNEASQGDILRPANYNCPGQIVISGQKDACKRAVVLAEKYGAIKAIELKVAGAFHTEIMSPAANELQQALEACDIADVSGVKVIANIDTDYYNTASQIRQGLVTQLVDALLWQKCMEKLLAEGVEDFYEIGPGRVLTGLMRRINRKTKVVNLSSAKSIEDLKAKMAAI